MILSRRQLLASLVGLGGAFTVPSSLVAKVVSHELPPLSFKFKIGDLVRFKDDFQSTKFGRITEIYDDIETLRRKKRIRYGNGIVPPAGTGRGIRALSLRWENYYLIGSESNFELVERNGTYYLSGTIPNGKIPHKVIIGDPVKINCFPPYRT